MKIHYEREFDVVSSKCSVDQIAEFWAYLDYAAFAINKAREKDVRKFGLSVVQNKVLVILELFDHNPTIGEIAHILLREHASVVNLTNKMEAKGLLRKYRDTVKKSIVRLDITPKGREAYKKIVKRESLVNILSSMSPEEYRLIKPFLNRIYEKALGEAGIANGIKIPEIWDLVGKEYKKHV